MADWKRCARKDCRGETYGEFCSDVCEQFDGAVKLLAKRDAEIERLRAAHGIVHAELHAFAAAAWGVEWMDVGPGWTEGQYKAMVDRIDRTLSGEEE